MFGTETVSEALDLFHLYPVILVWPFRIFFIEGEPVPGILALYIQMLVTGRVDERQLR